MVLDMLRSCFMAMMLVAVSISDVRHRTICDVLVLGIIMVQACYLAATAASALQAVRSVMSHAGSAALVTGVLLVACAIAHRITGHDGMGGGDVKLIGALAFALGVRGLAQAVFAASLIAVAFSFMKRRAMDETFPFCPYLSLGWLVAQIIG